MMPDIKLTAGGNATPGPHRRTWCQNGDLTTAGRPVGRKVVREEERGMELVQIVIGGSIDRDGLEEAIAEAFAGLGDLVPYGLDDEDSGLDLELTRDLPEDEVLDRLFGVIDDLDAGDAVRVRPADDEDWIRLSDWRS
jgi:hypothetical protein